MRFFLRMGPLLFVGRVGEAAQDNRKKGLSRIGGGEARECRQNRDGESEIRVSLTS